MTPDECLDLFAYNDWANGRVFDVLATLSDEDWTRPVGGSFHTVQATAVHLVGAEWIWLERWRGTSPAETPAWIGEIAFAELRDRLTGIEGERRAFLATLDEGALATELHYTFMSGDRRVSRLDLLFRHLVNHSSYHRGQIATLLRQMGKTPPSTDLVVWDDQRRGP